MIKPCKEDWAYFAGLLDGEGTFTVIVQQRENRKVAWHRGTRRTGNGVQLSPTVTFGMKSQPMTEWAKETFGGLSFSWNARGMYGWRLQRFGALQELLVQLLPHLRLKKEQARLLLEFIEHRIDSEMDEGRYHSPYDARCFELAYKIRSLNGNKKAILIDDVPV